MEEKLSVAIVYSVIVAVYNSENSLVQLVNRLKSAFIDLNIVEFIFVDDNSKDESWSVLNDLKLENPSLIRLFRHSKNLGQHKALRSGFNHSIGQLIITIDDDLESLPEEIPKLIRSIETSNVDLVYGVSIFQEHTSLFWRIGSKYTKKAIGFLFNVPPVGSSFRVFERGLVSSSNYLSYRYFFIDIVLLMFSVRSKWVTIKWSSEKASASGYSTWTKGLMVRAIFYTWLRLRFRHF